MRVVSDFKAEKLIREFSGGIDAPVGQNTLPAGFDIAQTVSTLWREKWRVALATMTALFASAIYLGYFAVPKFSATAVLMLETREETVVDLESVMSGLSADLATINTEIEVMRSRHLIGRVVAELGLEGDPEFNPELRSDPLAPLREYLIGLNFIDASLPKDTTFVRQKAIDLLLEATSVSPVRQSYVFRISALTDSAAKSAIIANKIADLYIVDQLDVKAAANAQASDWLRDQVKQLGKKLEDNEAKVEDYVVATPLIGEDALASLKRQVKDMRVRRDSAVAAGALAQARTLATTITGLESKIRSQSADLLQLRQLQRETEASLQIHQHFMARLKEIAVQQGLQNPDARVISAAAKPIRAATPKIAQTLSLAGIFGLLTGAGLVLARERMAQGFTTLGDLEDTTGVPVLGSIPLAPVRRREKILKYILQHPSSAIVEAVRNLRTSLFLRDTGAPPQVVLLTSSVPGEGKSTLALLLAHNSSVIGKRVLIIEADLRRRTFERFFGQPGGPGLCGVLQNAATFKDALISVPGCKFDALPGGLATENPADLFSSGKFLKLIDALRNEYDLIIIDAPPVLPVPDARIIARVTDAVIYSVRWRRTTNIQVKLGLDMLRSVDAKLAGLAMTQVNNAKMAQYHGYGGYGAYKAGLSYLSN